MGGDTGCEHADLAVEEVLDLFVVDLQERHHNLFWDAVSSCRPVDFTHCYNSFIQVLLRGS